MTKKHPPNRNTLWLVFVNGKAVSTVDGMKTAFFYSRKAARAFTVQYNRERQAQLRHGAALILPAITAPKRYIRM